LGKRHERQKRPRSGKKNSKISYKEYRESCRFKFEINNFPDEFDLDFIEIHGWYTADNLNGVSRDHMLSISYGWKNEIPPRIMRHPANCQLMLYQSNQDKGWRSSINLQNLKERIKTWNKKYK
jgi:hypothetical protein